jgi:hypothetical protein
MGERAGNGDLTEPFVCESPVPFDAGCDGEWPLMEVERATFFGVEPFEMLAKPFDVACVLLSSDRILLSTKRLRFVGGFRSGLLTLEPNVSTSSAQAAFESVVSECPRESWMPGDEWRRRRELRVLGSSSTSADCGAGALSDGNTASRIEVVECETECSVLVDWSGRFGMSRSLVAAGAELFRVLSSARSTERQGRRTWRE